jgi:hypothetical protein
MPDDRDTLPRWRANMDASDLRRYVMRAVKASERIMYDAYDRGDDDLALKAATRLTQAAQTYLKVLEADDLEERIEAIEAALENQTAFQTRRN